MTSLAGTASAVAGLGFGNVGTRQIAAAIGRDDAAGIAAARRALFWGSLVLAVLGATVFWALRDVLAQRVLGDTSLSNEVGWLALAVGLTVASASQSALLNGMRRIGDLARVSVLSAVFSTVLGVCALMIWGRSGLMVFVLAVPLASFVIGLIYVARLPSVTAPRTPLPEMLRQWEALAKLGAAFMVAGLVVLLGQLLVRTLVQQELGSDSLGYYQAAATISMTYIGFVLTAMGTDYYPRLTAVIHDHAAVNRMVNEQTEVALLLAGPVFLAMMGLAPWVIELLYSSSFHEAADVLRWQVLGDVLKVASWPLGFIILAAGDGRTFMVTESVASGVFVLLTWLGLSWLGVEATGVAFIGMYIVYLPIVYWLAYRKTGFLWSPTVRRQLGWLILTVMAVLAAAEWTLMASVLAGLISGAGYGIYGFSRLAYKTNMKGPVGRLAVFSRNCIEKIRGWCAWL